MTTIMLSGVGALGGWALEFLARSDGVDRIVTLKRSPWSGPSAAVLAMLGATFQGHAKSYEHHHVDLADTDALARVLAQVRPEAIIHSATVQSPRLLMQSGVDPGVRATLRTARFGMWLPWHLLPAVQLQAGIIKSGINAHVVNATFPDVVNVAVWRHFGQGPTAGAGNVEVCAARVLRYVMERTGASMTDVEVSLVGSHALLAYGPAVPHHFRLKVAGKDVTDEYDLDEILMRWPEPIDWGRSDNFAVFAASAVKNVLALTGQLDVRTHVTSPDGRPGGYPAVIGPTGVALMLPEGLSEAKAIALNDDAARWDGVEEITADGTVRYTAEAAATMAQLGYPYVEVGVDELETRSKQLKILYQDATKETSHSNL